MLTCATLLPVTRRIDEDDPRITAHRMPMALAHDALLDIISSADLMQKAIYNAQPESEIDRYRETARAQFEAYLDLMAQAATNVRSIKEP